MAKSSAHAEEPNNPDSGQAAESSKAAGKEKSARKRGTKRTTRRKKAEPNPYADFDRTQLADKTRVFTLAKALGVPSKELVVALADLGIVKVAQSTLTRAESEQLLDALAAAPASSSAKKNTKKNSADDGAGEGAADAQADDADQKIRKRVRKDVENEIHQIEQKVDAELHAEELLTDVEPDVAPAPEEEDASTRTPLFKAPSRSKRRRATRSSASSADEAPAEEAPAKVSAAKANAAKEADTDIDFDAELDRIFEDAPVEADETEEADEIEVIEEPKAIKGSSRLEAQRRRRSEKREEDRKRSRIVSQAEFLARRESVERLMVVRERDRHDGRGRITQVGVLEDGLLVEHFVTSDAQASMIGNIYLGRVQNVLPSMEAAFIDIGQGRNGVLYASEVDWKSAGLGGRSRRIEHALKSGDQVLVQVTKDPVGHKGARLSTQISLAGRYLVYVPGGRSAGISRKLPAPERKRLKDILNNVVPGKGGAIIRTAAEGVPEEAIAADVNRLHTQWEAIQEQAEKAKRAKGAKPVTLYEEPNLLVKVVRDLFNEDFTSLIVDGNKAWNTVHAYVQSVAPDLLDRVEKFDRGAHERKDAFEVHRVDEQISKALSRMVWLPSGGTLVIDRTEAMTVIDVNTGKFTGSGGSLEETVTSNNLEAAEEIVRQIRLRDIGGMIIIDFIDMILPENQELVLRRLKEALGRDRTRHQVSEVTSLGLVQMTRKRLGTGLLETFSTPCECCDGRGVVLSEDPIEADRPAEFAAERSRSRRNKKQQLDDGSLDNLIDSIVTEPEADTDPADSADSESVRESDADDSQADDREGGRRRSQRRRGRRGGSRGRGRAEVETRESDQTESDETRTREPRTSEPADAEPEKQSEEKTFEQAVEEFETSPRRKRRTRGNSRSDHRPRREDFAQDKEESREETSSAPARVKVETSTGPRGRRRATRKMTRPSQAGAAAASSQEQPKTERSSSRQSSSRQTASRQSSSRQTASRQSASPRRGRRRATRKSSEG